MDDELAPPITRHSLEPDLHNRPPRAILEEADAILDQADIEAHLSLGLEHANTASDRRLLAGHEQILFIWNLPPIGWARRDRPAEWVALGRAAAVGIPIHTHAPKAAWLDHILAALDRGEHVVGAVFVAGWRPIGADGHLTGILDLWRHGDRVALHHRLGGNIAVGDLDLGLATAGDCDLARLLDQVAEAIARAHGVGVDTIGQQRVVNCLAVPDVPLQHWP